MDMYPSRVTLFDDGIYRWSYDLDMWHNRYMLRMILKILCVVLGIPTLLIAAMLLTVIIYAICAAVMRGTLRLCFEMDESAVALVQSAETKNRNSALAAVADAVEIAALFSGKSTRSLRASSNALRMANESGITPFDSVRKARPQPDHDLIDLRQIFVRNQIYVNREDYAFVRDFILERVREKARP